MGDSKADKKVEAASGIYIKKNIYIKKKTIPTAWGCSKVYPKYSFFTKNDFNFENDNKLKIICLDLSCSC